jgi:hypothetical protein
MEMDIETKTHIVSSSRRRLEEQMWNSLDLESDSLAKTKIGSPSEI